MPKSTGSGFDWRQFAGHASLFASLLLFVGLLVGVTAGVGPLESRAADVIAPGPTQIRIAWPPVAGGGEGTWLPKADQETLLNAARAAAGQTPDPFSVEPLKAISTAMGATGWFDGTPVARRIAGAGVVVEGTWRIPAAVIRWEGKDYLISWDARPMPPVYEPGAARLPVVLGSPVGPPGGTGPGRDLHTPWAGEGVGAALELIQTISQQKWASQVAGVDISEFASSSVLAIMTKDQSRVVWGGRPSRPRMGEVTTAQKLVHLSQLYRDHRRIDAGYPLIYVNTQRIQFDLSASAAAARGTP